jgi:uncharacterized membrane protein
VGVGVAIIVAVAARFVLRTPLWLDEALTVNISRLPLVDIPDALRQDGLPPLYYFLLHGWMRLFGEGDGAVRALSGALGLVSLPLAWLAARRIGDRALAWIAIVLLATSPFAVRYSTETRMYSLVIVLVLAGWLCLHAALERARPLPLVGLGLVSGGLLLTHYWALWLVAAVVIVLAVAGWRASEAATRRNAWFAAGAVVAGSLLFLPWLPIFLDQLAHTGTPWAGPVRPTAFLSMTLADFGGSSDRYRDGDFLGFLMAMLALVALFTRAIDRRRLEIDLHTVPPVQGEAVVIALTALLGVGASWLAGAAYQSRYAAVIFPLLVLVSAVGAWRFEGRAARALVVGLVVVLSLGITVINATVSRSQSADLASAIEADAQPGDLVVYCPDQLGPAVSRLLPDGFEQVTYPALDDPERVDWRDYEERMAAADPAEVAEQVLALAGEDAGAGGRTIWLVSSPSYRTPGDDCDALRDQLSATLGVETVVQENAVDHFEHASLYRYSPG